MRTSTETPPDQAPPRADPAFHPAAALSPFMDVDGAEFGEQVVGDQRLRGEATP